jgi:FkbH-like protein
MEKNYFILRNYTVEPLFNGVDGCAFSGYNDTHFDKDYKYYLWFYTFPIKAQEHLVAEEIEFLGKNLAFIADAIPIDSTLLCFTISETVRFRLTSENKIITALTNYNNLIRELARRKQNIKVLEFDTFASNYSVSEITDYRHFYMSQVPVNPKLAKDFREWFSLKIKAIEGKRKKCLVLDLDNTLWGGILGEDGIAGIKMGNTYPGNCFSDFQSYIKEIKKTGVILAICSKNNASDVEELFKKRSDMVLSPDDFAATRINWNNKVDNIKDLAKELNIGTDSIVFIDDTAFEREHVMSLLPEVMVPEFPKQPYELTGFIKEIYNSWFQVYELTDEDAGKTEQYKQNALRQKAIVQHSSMDDFLREMQIVLKISESNPVNFPRIAQMTQKTNQFNLTTRRYTDIEISGMVKSGYKIWDASVSDKFGDNGITALAIVKIVGENANIDTFLMSCRILGRGVEKAFLSYIINKLYEKGITTIEASYMPTEKNIQVNDFYENNGFELVNQDEKGEKQYKFYPNSILSIDDAFGIK